MQKSLIINQSLSVTLLFLWVSAKLFCFVLSEALTRDQDWIGADLPPPSLARYVLDDLELLGVGNMQAWIAREWCWEFVTLKTAKRHRIKPDWDLFSLMFLCHLLEPQLLKLIRCSLDERHVSIPTTARKHPWHPTWHIVSHSEDNWSFQSFRLRETVCLCLKHTCFPCPTICNNC